MNKLSSDIDTLSSAKIFKQTKSKLRELVTGYHDDMPSWRDNVGWFETYSSYNGAGRISLSWENQSAINQNSLLIHAEIPLINCFALETWFDISICRLTLISIRYASRGEYIAVTHGKYRKWRRSLNPRLLCPYLLCISAEALTNASTCV